MWARRTRGEVRIVGDASHMQREVRDGILRAEREVHRVRHAHAVAVVRAGRGLIGRETRHLLAQDVEVQHAPLAPHCPVVGFVTCSIARTRTLATAQSDRKAHDAQAAVQPCSSTLRVSSCRRRLQPVAPPSQEQQPLWKQKQGAHCRKGSGHEAPGTCGWHRYPPPQPCQGRTADSANTNPRSSTLRSRCTPFRYTCTTAASRKLPAAITPGSAKWCTPSCEGGPGAGVSRALAACVQGLSAVNAHTFVVTLRGTTLCKIHKAT